MSTFFNSKFQPQSALPAETPENLKEKGNSLYQSSFFSDAKEAYTTAMHLLHYTTGGSISDRFVSSSSNEGSKNLGNIMLLAVLHSNRGNCCFELGDYNGAVQDSRDALELVGVYRCTRTGSGNESDQASRQQIVLLQQKNLWRLGRALFYNKENNALKKLVRSLDESMDDSMEMIREKLTTLEHSLSFFESELFHENNTKSSHEEIMSNHKDYLRGDDREDLMTSSSIMYSPQIIRSSFSDPATEYYPFGHDVSESALEDVNMELVLANQSEINILYGGVGDGRHVLATILDVHHQKKKSATIREKQNNFKIHITMNDVNAQVLLKDIFVIIITQRLGSLAPEELKSLTEKDEVFMLASVIYYATLAYAMPPAIYEKLQELVKEIFLEATYDSFCMAHSWLKVYEVDWPVFQRIASYWIDTTIYDPPLRSVKDMLDLHCPKNPYEHSKGLDYAKMVEMGLDSSQLDNMRRMEEQRGREKKEQIENYLKSLKDISKWPQEFLEAMSKMCEDGASNETISEFGISHMRKILEEEGQFDMTDGYPALSRTALVLDKTFVLATHTLLPPAREVDRPLLGLEKEVDLANKVSRNLKTKGKDLDKALQEIRDHIHSHWKVNPVKIDPDYHSWKKGVDERDETFAVTEFCVMFFHKGIQKKMFLEPPTWHGEFKHVTFFQILALFYINTGRAMANLVNDNNLSIEVSYGDVLAFGEKAQFHASERLSAGLPAQFSRIMLSNIPDYTGLLSIFTRLHPLLAKDSPNMASSLRSNVLLNTTLFQSYDEYVSGTVAMTAAQSARLLRLGVKEDQPDVWNIFNQWGHDENSFRKHPVSVIEFQTWLHRLYLVCVLPPLRDNYKRVSEQRPNTTGLFLVMCKHCIFLGYPVHWIAIVLDQLLTATATNPLKTKAMIANQSPSSVTIEKKIQKYNLSAFCLELQNQLSMCIQSGLLPDSIVAINKLPVKKRRQYQLKAYPPPMRLLRNVLCVGFLLEKEVNVEYRDKLTHSIRPGSPLLRDDLLQKGDAVGHLFSCAQYNSILNTMTFYMCEDTFEKFSDYYFSIVSTDSWQCIDHPSIRLGEAICIG